MIAFTSFESRPVRAAWFMAFLIAGGLHAAAFVGIWSHARLDESEDVLGAPAIEIGLELTAPRSEESDLPPGPEAEASAASAAAQEQKAKVEDSALPKARPTDTQDPDSLVSPDAAKPRKDDTPKVTEVKANPVADSVPSEAAAPPKVDTAREAPRSAAPAVGPGESAQRARATWQKQLVAHLGRFKRYPEGEARIAVDVMMTFTLDRLGHVVEASLSKSSGNRAFDDAALAMMKKADPVPPPPPLVADEGLRFSIPVNFRDKHK